MSSLSLTIDGRPVTAPAGATIWDAAKAAGIDIPVLCHHEKLRPVGVCRMCVVDTGGRVLADRSLSRLLGADWPRSIDELE